MFLVHNIEDYNFQFHPKISLVYLVDKFDPIVHLYFKEPLKTG